ncbi:hypothetical protein H4R19_003148 [Coemansia spiralis]|nr:hypothetical protein H4R19_003148 [Coemansia spiralis]
MFRRRCYREASLWAQHLSSSNIDGSVAGLVLRALREQQRAAALPPAQRRRDMSIHMYFALVDACEVNLQAQRVLRLLRRNSAGSVTEGLLAKALEIELASVPPEWRLPRTPDLLLREFRRCRIDPGTRSLLMVAGAYRTRGDPDFAQLVLAPIAANPLEASHDDASIGAVAACHALDEMRARGQRPPAPLVTSAVAWMVDAERVTDAERLWRDHGCQCAVAADRRPNVRALAKLILGYTQTGSVEKATAFFHDICAYEAAGAGTDSSAYLTGLLSAVLRSATRDIAAGGPAPARYDLLVLRIAEGFQVPFDAATYNVLFAGLSREAHVHLSAAHAAPPSQLDKIAQVMHRLYRHMAEHNVAPDDVTATHLLPLWVVLGRIDLARALWEQYMGGRSPRTADQLRGHVLNQARRWGVADRIRPLIGAP